MLLSLLGVDLALDRIRARGLLLSGPLLHPATSASAASIMIG
jgi:hypothetical protein